MINRMTGLAADSSEILDTTMDIMMAFLRETHQPMRTKTQMIREWMGPLTKPLGAPGDIHWHPVGEETLFSKNTTQNGESIPIEENENKEYVEVQERVGSIDEGRERFDGSIDANVVLGDTAAASKKRDEMVES